MRITAIVDESGQLIAATPGPLGDPEALAAGAGDEGGGDIELTQGQAAREIEVSDTLFENGDPEELARHISEQLS
jgi:hypothetical protein